jgi:transcriptional regulator with XRE-family HTH domain
MATDDREVHKVEDHREFGENIRAARKAAKISRAVAAERAGISVGYLGEVERGERWPRLNVTRAIARAIGVSPARFFEFEDKEAGTPIERLNSTLKNRTTEQQRQALRVVRALLAT